MRTTRTESYTMEHFRQIETMTCNNCGEVVDNEPMKRPEGWHSLFHQEQGKNTTFDFCGYECLYGFITANEDGLPPAYLEPWVRSIEEINQQRAEEEADKILSGVE